MTDSLQDPTPEPQVVYVVREERRRSGALGIIAVLLALASLVMAFIPVTSGWAILTSFIAFVLGLVALFSRHGVGAGIAAAIIGIIALALAIVFAIIYGFFRILFGW